MRTYKFRAINHRMLCCFTVAEVAAASFEEALTHIHRLGWRWEGQGIDEGYYWVEAVVYYVAPSEPQVYIVPEPLRSGMTRRRCRDCDWEFRYGGNSDIERWKETPLCDVVERDPGIRDLRIGNGAPREEWPE
jgi:hypothetical protein